MIRALVALGGTAAGLAALLSFKTHVPSATVADSGPAQPTMTASGAARPAVAAAGGTHRGSSRSMTRTRTKMMRASASASSSSSTATRTVTGAVESTMYGPMQVKVTLSGKRITNVAVVQQTDQGQVSQTIDASAIPKLTAETLTAQSARIDAVSGATSTSQGYIGSLQSALDRA